MLVKIAKMAKVAKTRSVRLLSLLRSLPELRLAVGLPHLWSVVYTKPGLAVFMPVLREPALPGCWMIPDQIAFFFLKHDAKLLFCDINLLDWIVSQSFQYEWHIILSQCIFWMLFWCLDLESKLESDLVAFTCVPENNVLQNVQAIERALSCHNRNIFMLTNLARPINRLEGLGLGLHYSVEQRLHHRQDSESWRRRLKRCFWMKIINEWECNPATFSKSLNPRNIEKSVSDIRIRIRFPFESSFRISVSGFKLTRDNHYQVCRLDIQQDSEFPTG